MRIHYRDCRGLEVTTQPLVGLELLTDDGQPHPWIVLLEYIEGSGLTDPVEVKIWNQEDQQG